MRRAVPRTVDTCFGCGADGHALNCLDKIPLKVWDLLRHGIRPIDLTHCAGRVKVSYVRNDINSYGPVNQG